MSVASRVFQPEAPRRGRRRLRPQPLKLVVPPGPPPAVRLPEIARTERQGPILRPSPLSEILDAEVESLNLTSGCLHQCSFCFARAYPGYGDNKNIAFFANTSEKLRAELEARRTQPRAVYLCPSTDPFPPFREVQEEACRVAEVLAEFGIEAWFMTRGIIRPFALARLEALRETVKITVPVTTLDNSLRRILEPLTAPPKLRLKQIKILREAGFRTNAAIDPLIPGLTDTRENLEPLLDALADVGVEHLTVGYLFLRRGIRENIIRELGPTGLADPILSTYGEGPVLPMGSIAPAKHLPRALRQRGYAFVMALAASRGITVNILRLSNPDFTSGRESLNGPQRFRQSLLPYETA